MYAKNSGFFLVIILFVVGGCNSKEIARLQIENDSLRKALNAEGAAMRSVLFVKMSLDSIDAGRDLLVSDLAEGSGRAKFSSRLANINQFVKTSEERIATIEKALQSSNLDSRGYSILVDALKDELQLRVDELVKLNELVTKSESENEGLEETIKIRQNEVNGMRRQSMSKEQEVRLLEAKIQAMIQNFKAAEADAYYARAHAIEETARRTKLAPRKKRETYKEALELYKKALSLGKREAGSDIVRLGRMSAN